MRELELGELLAGLELLSESCRGAVTITHRGELSLGADKEAFGTVEIGPGGGEWLELGVAPTRLRIRFGGWIEMLEVDGEPEDCTDSALDFVAAAMFGELRVIEDRLRGQVLRRSLEVEIGSSWRRYARRGRLGLTGLRAWLGGSLERRVRGNDERVARPKLLRHAAPRGLPTAPWVGAGLAGAVEDGVELEIDGELDLHNFSPKEVASLVREYIEVCLQRDVLDLRIVHGKGKGVLRRTVHSLLAKHPAVDSYRLGGQGEGSWGATIVRLRK